MVQYPHYLNLYSKLIFFLTQVSNQEERQQPGPQRERCLEQTRQELSSNAAPSPAQPPTPPSTQVVSRSDQQPNVQGDRFIPPTTQQVQQAQPGKYHSLRCSYLRLTLFLNN